ncbi:MAG: 50S ribosomal protein L28 [Candidatus Omnitrophica bacterium]|nr:50S ribosomal protein L28 [Candidatus Omnitrophota bacterium]
MSRRCGICGKKAQTGSSIARRGLPKAKGGVGLKTTGITKRRFLPNLQSRRVIVKGKVKKTLVCTKCIKAGKLSFASRKSSTPDN